MKKLNSAEVAVNEVLAHLGEKIVVASPLAAGKPNHLLNALYTRAKNNPKIDLTICTALTLERPKPKSDLEARFLNPFVERVFGDYPDLEFELDRMAEKLPKNIRVVEFYFSPGKYLANDTAQQHYVSSNYTHVYRDMIDRGVNLIFQMIAVEGDFLSLGCNADVSGDLIDYFKRSEKPSMIVGQVNTNMPFMYGDADLPQSTFDIIVDDPGQYYKMFSAPKMAISDVDYMIGLYASTLVKDDGELQLGIGSLGDAIVYGLILRHQNNDQYLALLKNLNVLGRFASTLERIGETGPFTNGLFGATEMMVDGFMELYEAGILKKKVFDHAGLQRLINQKIIDPLNIQSRIMYDLVEAGVIPKELNRENVDFLKVWGVLTRQYRLPESGFVTATEIESQYIGKTLLNGHLMHAGFFLGPQKFYQWLHDLPVATRKQFAMKSVLKINQLYGHEEIDRLHRKNARFINTCMMTTLSGAHVSDGLEDGRVVSGVGGQYNFVAMAQELPDGHSVLTMRSTRSKGGKTVSNIVFRYGHITIPRHLRDILVTEYGIAFLRGKTDEEVVIELLNVCDSRFQKQLMNDAKKAGKLRHNYKIPKAFQNNTFEPYENLLNIKKDEGLFPKFPFGTDLTDEEIIVGGALKRLNDRLSGSSRTKLSTAFQALRARPTDSQSQLLKRLDLDEPKNLKEKLYQKLVLTELPSGEVPGQDKSRG